MALKHDSLDNGLIRHRRSRREIVDAAIRCIRKLGSQQSTMTDFAREAGISRKTLYLMFVDRSALIEQVLNVRIASLFEKTRKEILKYESLADALVEGSILSIAAGRRDELLNDIIQNDTNHRIEQFLISGNDQVREYLLQMWSPVIDKGREQGRVRSGLSNDRIVELIISVHAVLFMRDDYREVDQRAFLEDLLVPAITVP